MLVLTRRLNESIVINGDIVITVLEVGRNGQVRLGIEAPRNYQIYRRELWLEIEQENQQALTSAADSQKNNTTPPMIPSDSSTSETAKIKSPCSSREPTPNGSQTVSS